MDWICGRFKLNRMINIIEYTTNKYKPFFDYWKGIRVEPERFDFSIASSSATAEAYKHYDFSLTAEKSRLVMGASDRKMGDWAAEIIGAFSFLFHKYTGQNQVILHTPVHKGTSGKIIEPFLPLCISIKEDVTLDEYFNETLASIRSAYQFQNFPLVLVRQKNTHYLQSNILLMMDVFHYDFPENSWIGNYAMVIKVSFKEEKMTVCVTYRESDFPTWFINNLSLHLDSFLNYYKRKQVKLADIDIISASELDKITSFSYTKMDYPAEQTIHGLFEQKAQDYPERKALIDKNINFSYRTLNERANQLAHFLIKERLLKKGSVVAICLKRSPWQLISMLAIMKAGGIYLPVDMQVPESRFLFMVEDAKVSLLLTDESTADLLRLPDRTLRLDDALVDLFDKFDTGVEVDPDDPAYIIYTSGTTGQPKGVVIRHRGVINMATDQIRRFGIRSGDRVVSFASVSFDASVSEYLMALYAGAALIVIHETEIENTQLLISSFVDNRVSVATLPPVYLNILDIHKLTFLRVLITAGEPADQVKAEYLSNFLEYYNAYGPTEYSVCTTIFKVFPGKGKSKRVPIGSPIANTEVFVLEDKKRPVPIGIPGKLYVSGVGLSTGYINRPVLNTEKFILKPGSNNEMMYDTGDLVRWLPDGNLDFIGRVDELVKINGIRVEPEDISAAIQTHTNVDKCVVVPVSFDGQTRLAAFVKLNSKELIPDCDTVLRHYLKAILPSYMIPFRILEILEFPLNSSRKIDKGKLLDSLKLSASYIAPSSPNEFKMQEIWQSLLSFTPIGVTDDFFKLGATSINIIALHSKLIESYPDFDILNIFKYPVLKDFTAIFFNKQC
jgi:amino acid adenylation domain-containing protein